MADVAIELQALPDNHHESQPASELAEEILVSDLAPVDKGRDAWLFVIAAFTLETFLWGFGFTFGVFQNYYASSPDSPFRDSSTSAISAIGTTSIAVPYVTGLFLPSLMSRHPRYIRPAMWCALALGTAAFLLSSFATAVWHLIILQGVLVGIAGGILYTPVFLWLYEWFAERRGLAGGIIQSGVGIGGAVFPPILGILLDRVGFRWTLRIWAIAFVIFSGTAVWFIKPRLPVPSRREPRRAPADLSYLRNPLWAVVAITILIQSLAYFPVNLYLPTYTTLLGLPALDGQLVLSVFNIFSVVGQILFGWMCDRMPYSRVMAFSAIGSALSAYLLWGFASSLGVVFAFAVAFGTMAGGFFSISAPVAADLAGPSSTASGSIFGSLVAWKAIAAVVGPIIAATLFDSSKAGMTSKFGSNGFGGVTLFVGGMMMATAAFSVLSGVTRNIHRRHSIGL